LLYYPLAAVIARCAAPHAQMAIRAAGRPASLTSASPVCHGRATGARERCARCDAAATKEVAVAGVQALDFDSPDETRRPDKTQVDVIRLEGITAARYTFQPGWRWSDCVKPVAGTDSCQVRHVGIVQSGRLHVTHEDGSDAEVGPGDAYLIEPGHDAWVVGDDAFVGFEFESRSAEEYARG
jgi:hypothetical protein